MTAGVDNDTAKQIRYCWAVTAIAIFFLSLCLCSEIPAAEFATLSGRILNVAGKPVQGAEVFAYTTADVKRPADFMSGKSTPEGNYQLVLPEGSYWIVGRLRTDNAQFGPLSSKDKHSGEPKPMEISAGGNQLLDLTVADIREAAILHRSKNADNSILVQGRIVDPNGQPVAMAYALASSRNKPGDVPEFLSGWTGTDGKYSLYLPPGEQYLGGATIFPPPLDIQLEEKITVTADTQLKDIVLGDSVPSKVMKKHHNMDTNVWWNDSTTD